MIKSVTLTALALVLGACSALESESDSPSVVIDRPLDKASYALLDVPLLPELDALTMAHVDRSNDAPIRYSKNGDTARYEVWLDDVHYLTVTAALTSASEKKSELDVNVQLEDSPFTADYGLLESDIPLIETMLDGALTEYIAAKLEGRGTGSYDLDHLEARLDWATFFQREAFAKRLENAVEGTFKPLLEKYSGGSKSGSRRSSQDDSDYRGYQEADRMRQAQREAAKPTSTAEPTTQLPTNR